MTLRTQSHLLTMASHGLVPAYLNTVPVASSNPVTMVPPDISRTHLVHSLYFRAFARASPFTSNAHLPAPGVWGLYLLVSCVSVGENVDCICSFIQEIFIETTIMNKADRVSAVVELYY